MKKKIAILGSTGSIGKTLINILKKDKKNVEIFLLTAHKNYKELFKQIQIFNVKNIIITDPISYLKVKKLLKKRKINVFSSLDALNKIFIKKKIDYTMSAISGFSGLKPTLDIIKYSKTIAIANKESIICGWSLIKKCLKKYNTQFIPVDSEHFSIWSLTNKSFNNKINKSFNNNIEKVFITASGGPFKDYPIKKFKSITRKQALKHPSWSMGNKISIDSATLMNKVFEIIEAKKIFNLRYNQLEILVHPKSYVHALVKFDNGLLKILVHDTDMTIPIFNSLYQNNERKIKSKKVNISFLNNLDFKKVNIMKFPIVKLINTLPEHESLFETVIVSANDCLVKNFLVNKVSFLKISKILLEITKKKEFQKYKSIKPRNIGQIRSLNDYVSLKIDALCV
jgi:1-deoxy-D-xylulose-5-phosphate reductoisomerase